MEFTIRQSNIKDLERIMPVYDSARAFMRSRGNTRQWTGGYPSRKTILDDIYHGYHYLAEDDEGNLLMVFSFIVGKDPTYRHIHNGAWPDDEPYGTIHRLASTGIKGGMLKECVSFCSQFIDNIRIDTHADNGPMQNAIKHAGFAFCGIIHTSDGSPRLAFQKKLRPTIPFAIKFTRPE